MFQKINELLIFMIDHFVCLFVCLFLSKVHIESLVFNFKQGTFPEKRSDIWKLTVRGTHWEGHSVFVT